MLTQAATFSTESAIATPAFGLDSLLDHVEEVGNKHDDWIRVKVDDINLNDGHRVYIDFNSSRINLCSCSSDTVLFALQLHFEIYPEPSLHDRYDAQWLLLLTSH